MWRLPPPGKIVVTDQTRNGSLANLAGIAGGALESGSSPADVASWAYTGKGAVEGKPAITGLRLSANLYPESVHSVARKAVGIKTVADLKGKRDGGSPAGAIAERALSGAGIELRCLAWSAR